MKFYERLVQETQEEKKGSTAHRLFKEHLKVRSAKMNIFYF